MGIWDTINMINVENDVNAFSIHGVEHYQKAGCLHWKTTTSICARKPTCKDKDEFR